MGGTIRRGSYPFHSSGGAVYAAFNSAQGPNEIVSMVHGDHKTYHDEFGPRRDQWLLQGQPAPVAANK
ncbi:MAG: hypothetical protein P4L99_20910 [Chthoniobacter sp.]|nr:hypothetical protein [Chthoniobacter sp.]